MQEGRMAVLEAEKTWNPEKGAFSTWAHFYIRKAMRRCLGISSVNGTIRPDPASLDAPTDADEELTLLDLIADPDAWEGEMLALQSETRSAVQAAIDELPGNLHTIARECLLGGRPLADVARELGIQQYQAAQAQAKAIASLRRLLLPYAVEKATDDATKWYRGKGVQSFQNTRNSVVEDIVFDREGKRLTMVQQRLTTVQP